MLLFIIVNKNKKVNVAYLCPIYVFWSVRPFVQFQVKVLVKVFGQGSFWWSWSPINLKLSKHVPYDMIFLISMPNKGLFLPHFHGPLNIENDNAVGASVYLGHILVCLSNVVVIGENPAFLTNRPTRLRQVNRQLSC